MEQDGIYVKLNTEVTRRRKHVREGKGIAKKWVWKILQISYSLDNWEEFAGR